MRRSIDAQLPRILTRNHIFPFVSVLARGSDGVTVARIGALVVAFAVPGRGAASRIAHLSVPVCDDASQL